MTLSRPTLHFSILALFIVFLLITAGTLTWYNYEKNSEAALDIADELLTEVNDKVLGRVDNMFGSTFQLADEVAELPYLANKPEFMSHDAQWYLVESLLVHPHIYSVYIGYLDGDFYQIISLIRAKKELREKLGAPEGTQVAIRRVFKRPQDKRRVELWQFFNEERRLVGSKTIRASRYDPRSRPWFRKAIGREGVTRTPFYVFTSTGSLGVTVASRFDGPVPGVFGVDITLSELSEFFAKQAVGKSGIVFMFDDERHLTAYPDPAKTISVKTFIRGQSLEQASLRATNDPLLVALDDKLKQDGVEGRKCLDVNGRKYLLHITPVRDERLGKQFVAVAAPVSDFTGSMDRIRERSLIFALIILLVAIPIAMYFSRIMSNPLKKLAKEADEIRHFNLESAIDVKSNIAEIADLTKAVKTMKSSLFTFGRYVPKALVRQLILSKLDPELGGERRELTLLFSDIADFTSISEGMDPEDLMLKVSDYLQVVGAEILQQEGTIDKFIGDAVMAFWNAPVLQENHAERACEAALKARHANESLNDRWAELGIPRMYTRFGLHTGDAIVGNVGSEDRMNYTAIGSAVNLASRLEGLNKYYETQILASESVVEQAGDRFLFRSVGKVMPKGTSIPVTIYELLGGIPGQCDEVIAVTPEMEASVSAWENAFGALQAQYFEKAADMFCALACACPDDRLACLMRERAIQYQADPPGKDWDGVDIFKTK